MASGADSGPGSGDGRPDDGDRTPPSAGSTASRTRGTGVFWLWGASFVAALALALVIIQNTHQVRFQFLWFDAQPPLLVVIVVAALLSALVTETVTAIWRHRRRLVRDERTELGQLRHDRRGA